MFQRNALTLKELQSIQCLRDRPVEAAETLLNVIMEQPDAVYLCFLDVLKGTEQQHIYQTLVETGYRGHYLPTVILIVIGIPLPTHSFIPNLKLFFCKSFPLQPFLFSLSIHYMDSPRLFTSEHIRLYFFSFLFHTFWLSLSCGRLN